MSVYSSRAVVAHYTVTAECPAVQQALSTSPCNDCTLYRFTNAPTNTLLHYNTCLHNSDDGQYMMSGGEEGVLVYWNLNRGTRAFLPRLGGPISCVQPDTHGAYCAVAVQDNRVIVVRLANWAVQWQVSNCTY
jgi:WD40 repeat protein